MPSPSFTIGQLSQRTGANIETIRYYERIGLLPVALRQGRYRSYGGTDVARLGFVRRSRELGFSIKEVRALLDLAAGGHESCAEARDLAAAHLHDVRSRIADLRRMERTLATTVRACNVGDDAGCPLIETFGENPKDELC
ncbi:MAG: helix-turn-helix domain-containing protein [Sphingomonas sp.]|uniref:MerR family transcriptional regulator n=1 Tax=Sphingomonas sp. TaxID=28214 RepID=UPI001825AC46|nr:helix-turn-helix domain-containing protein [Sphingomonas sp.]MBA3667423.1 helix-turn-helix domain-containing protein [Sphingomonas sp.]